MKLFKLKKDGKCVGYLKIASGFVFLKDMSRPNLDFQDYNYFHNTYCPTWDTAHPFVTTDKNGDEVFEFDKCIGELRDGGTIKGDVVVDGTDGFRMPVAPYIENKECEQRYLTECRSIELIGESND